MKTNRERAADNHVLKLEEVQRQIDDGSLVIREMTAEERLRYPPQPAPRLRPSSRQGRRT